MKQLIYCLLLLSPYYGMAQSNPCAEAKAQSYNHQRSKVATPHHNELERRYDVRYYHLSVNAERDTAAISGNVIIVAAVLRTNIDTFALELHPQMIVDSATINGTKVRVRRDSNDLSLIPTVALSSNTNATVQIYYHGTPRNNLGYGGINNMKGFVNPSIAVTWTFSEPYQAYEWWPCKQDLTDKADSSEIDITTDSSNMASSNGLLQRVVNLPNHKRKFEWVNNKPIDYYLMSMCVAQYTEHRSYAHPAGADSILLQSFIYADTTGFGNRLAKLDSIAQGIELLTQYFGPYPFNDQKYGVSMAGTAGGMENQTMTTQNTIGDISLNIHELAHHWFGDYVTCATWGDLWLNEGFASYCASLFFEVYYPSIPTIQYAQNDVMQQPTGSVYFRDTLSNFIFDNRLRYSKASAVLHTLRYLVNEDSLYFSAIRYYLSQHAFGTATTDQFHADMQHYTGVNLDYFFDEWIYGEGYPTFIIKYKQTGDSLYLQNQEFASASTITPMFILPIEYKITTTTGDTTVKLMQNAETNQYAIHVNGQVTNIAVDPNNWIINKATVINAPSLVYSGIENIPAPTMQLFPNPVHDQLILKVTGLQGSTTMKMYNTEGRLLLEKTISNGNTPINVSTLPVGVYLLKAYGNVLRFAKE